MRMHQKVSTMCLRGYVVLLCVAAVAALPSDILSRLNDGPRFQHVPADGQIRLTDTWLTGDSVARALRFTPDTDIVYHLFSRDNPTTSQPMLLGADTLIATNFDASRSTVVIVHGWASGPTSDAVLSLLPSILAAADVNVLVVDWSEGAYEPNYYAVVLRNVPSSGESIARFIFWLNSATGASLDTYHIIGFETGAHIAGVAGRTLSGLVPYITALEPPRPGFILNSNAFRSTDGIYTEAIHTNAFVTGLIRPVADVDFYPNGGVTMAGCEWTDWRCSRDRSYAYLAESIVSGGFTGTLCDNIIQALTGNCDGETTLAMGGLTAKTGSTGIYALTTNEQSPYSTG